MSNLDFETRFMLGLPPLAASAVEPSQKLFNWDRVKPAPSYEGAANTTRETALWTSPIRSADGDILPQKQKADARTRDTLRNDAYIQGAANLRRDTIVGSTYMLNARPNSTLLFGKEDTVWEDEYAEEIEGKFQLWAESPDNWVDAGRVNNFTQLVRLAVSIHAMGGEVLASAEWGRDWRPMRPYSTCVQMIDLDRLSNDPAVSDLAVRGGVRKDARGAPQGYYIRGAHPSDRADPESYKWKYSPVRLPWGRMSIIHIFDQDRADQTRGISMLVSALKETKMAKRFRDIVIQNAVVNATYAASIESELPTDAIFARLGGGAGNNTGEAVQKAINGYIGGYFAEIAKYVGGSRGLALDGVKIPHLPPGSKLQLRPAGNGGPLGDDFEASLMRYIAAATGTSYEELSRDFTKTNYSGFKGAVSVTQRSTAATKKNTADKFATTIFRLWFEEAHNNGAFETLKRRKKINLYENQGLDLLTQCAWIGASFGQIDELKETQAAALRINAGLSTLADEAARLGKDWRQLLKQLKREQDWKDFYKVLQVPVDTSKMTNASEGASKNGDEQTNPKKDG